MCVISVRNSVKLGPDSRRERLERPGPWDPERPDGVVLRLTTAGQLCYNTCGNLRFSAASCGTTALQVDHVGLDEEILLLASSYPVRQARLDLYFKRLPPFIKLTV